MFIIVWLVFDLIGSVLGYVLDHIFLTLVVIAIVVLFFVYDSENDAIHIKDFHATNEELKESALKSIAAFEKKRKSKGKIRPRAFVISFRGSITALRRAIHTVMLIINKDTDRVVLRIHSGGGAVETFGLGAATVLQLRKLGVNVVSCIDKMAASGGYLIACCSDRIVASPFAIVGSIGVVYEVPNLSRLLTRLGIDYQQITAGPLKRSIDYFCNPSEEKIKHTQERLNRLHSTFKSVVSQNRPKVVIEHVGTGDVWQGSEALDLGLVDELKTSDEYLRQDCAEYDVYELGVAVSNPKAEKSWLNRIFSVKRLLSRLQ